MNQTTYIGQGEIRVEFNSPPVGKVSFVDLGIPENKLFVENGFLRIVFDLSDMIDFEFYHDPMIEISYKESIENSHWQCDFNNETIIDKIDHSGNKTIILLDRYQINQLLQQNENKIILHAELPQKVHLLGEQSFINFFK